MVDMSREAPSTYRGDQKLEKCPIFLTYFSAMAENKVLLGAGAFVAGVAVASLLLKPKASNDAEELPPPAPGTQRFLLFGKNGQVLHKSSTSLR